MIKVILVFIFIQVSGFNMPTEGRGGRGSVGRRLVGREGRRGRRRPTVAVTAAKLFICTVT